MEFSLLLMKQIVAMFIMILVGFVVVKFKLLKSDDSSIVAKITLYVISPFMVLNACQMEYSHEKLVEFAVGMALAYAINFTYVGVTTLIKKPLRLSGAEQDSLIYSNSGNLIIPLVSALIGSEGVFYLCSFLMAQNTLFWTHGVYTMGGKEQISLKRIVTNPNLIAIVIGITFFACRIRLPEITKNAVAQLGSTIGPLSMMVIGMIIAGSDLKKIFSNRRAYFVTFGRLIVYPLTTILAFWALGAGRWDPRWKAILIIFMLCFSAPTASNVPQAAKVLESDADLASTINIMSVILCIVTIPLMTYIYQALCGAV